MLDLSRYIIEVPDFPKPGIVFRDFTPLLADPSALALAVELMANPFRGKSIDVVVGAESRGFIFGTAVAQSISAGFVPVRKAGKLPRVTRRVEYALEYGTDRLEVHADALDRCKRIVIVDDLLATGGTLAACCELVKTVKPDIEIAGISVLIELEGLKGAAKVGGGAPIYSVLKV
jgi:adenine phosphoribosyltransferase